VYSDRHIQTDVFNFALLFMMIASASELEKTQPLDKSAEMKLILACARCQADPDLIHYILDNFESALDWDRFVQTAYWHGVLPLIYRNLSNIAPHRIPRSALSQLLKLYLMNSGHNQRLTAALQELVALFNIRGIPIIFFKGPVLAEAAYGSIHLRRFSDIDVLVHETDVSAVRQLLISQGFKPNPHSWENLSNPNAENIGFAKETMRHSGEEAFIHEQTLVTIDLHWQLMPNFFAVPFDLEQIWSTRQAYSVEGVEVHSLNPQDLLLYLCAHGSKELWRYLIWVCDVAEVVRIYPNLPWLDLWSRSKVLGIERMFLLGLALAHDLLDLPLPLPLQEQVLSHIAVKDLVQTFKRRMFTDIQTLIEKRETGFWLFHNPLHLPLRERLRDRLPQYWLTLLFMVTPNDEDQQFLALPKGLYPLHYLVRPIRIFYKWIILRKQYSKDL
jgi:hypothetical protein